jgi:rod shape-determining protein MreC
VKPSVLPEAIGPVLVLLLARTERGVNGVWTTVHAADSAARAVAAAGDSLARAAALDELAARRAARDAAADTLADSTLAFVAGGLGTAADSAKAESVRTRARVDSIMRARTSGLRQAARGRAAAAYGPAADDAAMMQTTWRST